MSQCPSELGLEQYVLEPMCSPAGPHVASCPACQERAAEMRQVAVEFRREVYPDTVDRVLDTVEPRRRLALLLRLLPVPIFATAAAFVVLAMPQHRVEDQRRPPADYAGTKGAPMAMTVFGRTLDGARPLVDGGQVPPGTALRFQVHVRDVPCRLWLVSVDEASQVSRLYPASGEGGADLATPGPLPGGAILDGRIGPERIFAVCSPRPLPYAKVARAARKAAAGGADRVRTAGELPDLPAGVLQATLLVEKTR